MVGEKVLRCHGTSQRSHPETVEGTLGAPEPLSYVHICDFVTLQASSEGAGVNSEMERDLRVRSSAKRWELRRLKLLPARHLR